MQPGYAFAPRAAWSTTEPAVAPQQLLIALLGRLLPFGQLFSFCPSTSLCPFNQPLPLQPALARKPAPAHQPAFQPTHSTATASDPHNRTAKQQPFLGSIKSF